VRVGFDVGIHAHRNRRDLFQPGGDAVDALEFRLAFGIERVNALLEGELDFVLGLSHAREGASAGVATGVQDPLQLAAADDVEPGPEPGERAQDRLVGVGFDGEADEVVHPGHRAIKSLEMSAQRMLGINVQGSAELPGEGFKRNAFAIKFLAHITKIMHAAG